MNQENPPFLRQYLANIHSQNGEDGVIAEVLARIGYPVSSPGWCVEFGAWDGIHLSNTFALVERGWNAVHIEGDERKFGDLMNTAARFPKLVPLHAFVARHRDDADCLDKLLARTAIPVDFELLSIDIDSYDLDVWESLESYSPKVVVIEINSGIAPGILWRHGPKTQGNTFSATQNVAREKGYSLVLHTGNCIYVRNDLVGKVGIDQRYLKYPELLFDFRWLERAQ